MTYQELGKQIKSKYPQYKDYSDEDIGKKTASKYPEYAKLIEKPKRSLVEKIGGFLGIEKLGKGLAQAILPYTKEGKMMEQELQKGTIKPEEYEEVMTGGLRPKEIIGSAIQTAALPLYGGVAGLGAIGKALPATRALRMAKFGALGATEAGSQAFAEEKKPSEILKSAGLGGAIGAVAPEAISGGFKALGKIYKTLLSVGSGVPVPALERAYARPSQISKAIKKAKITEMDVPTIIRGIRTKIGEAKEMAFKTYDTAMAGVAEKYPKLKISFEPIKRKINTTLKKFRIDLSAEKPFAKSPISNPSEVKNLQRIIDDINTWDDFSFAGITALKKRIGNIAEGVFKQTREGALSTQYGKVITQIYDDISKSITGVVPEMKGINKLYSTTKTKLDLITKELGKPQSEARVANIFRKNRARYIEMLETAPEIGGEQILDDIAGSLFEPLLADYLRVAISGGVIGGLALTGQALPATLAGFLAASPRFAGFQARGAGYLSKVLQPIKKPAEVGLRTTLSKLLKGI